MLYLVATPIGNLKDISYRAVETLQGVDLIAAEDTRHTRILCEHYQIKTPLTSFFEHNQGSKAQAILKLLQEGKNIAVVTDAGTPGISDPGYPLIRLAQEHRIPMTVIPGPAAFLAALSLSGLPMDRFVFEGFLPVKSCARRKKLESLRQEPRTILFYESPHRLLKSLKDIEEIFGSPWVVCVRELTKKFEEVRRGTAAELRGYFTKVNPKGEFVLALNLRLAETPRTSLPVETEAVG